MLSTRDTYKNLLDVLLKDIHKAITKAQMVYPAIKSYVADADISKEVYSLGSRYLHRGYFCPSPDIEQMITNMRRGRIAKRLTKASRPTNRYLFDQKGNMILAETFYPNCVKKEYIFYEQDHRYGFDYDSYGRLTEISIEECSNGKISNYIWAACTYNEATGYEIFRIFYENFRYVDTNILETDFHIIEIPMQKCFLARWKAAYELDDGRRPIISSRKELLYDKALFSIIEDSSLS